MRATKILSVLLLSVTFAVNAQNLANVQQVSLRAPANIKVDGKAIEWNNQFQAYNVNTGFYYTLSNDDNNLYLTVQATDPAIISRIINGGITFTINRSGKEDDKNGMSITYPVFGKGNLFYPAFKIRIDSATIINYNNSNMAAKSKTIRVAGIKNVDTLISIDNIAGIKTAELFDSKLAYTYELSVALKQLNLSVTNPVKFAYQLRINEVKEQEIDYKKDASGKIIGRTWTKGVSINAQSATDFLGEYTLAK